MKLTCKRDLLTAAFQTACGVVPARSPKDIVQNIKVAAAADHAVLIATDTEVSIRFRVADAEVAAQGELLLPATHALSILREMQGDQVTIESGVSCVHIRGERANYKLGAADPAEFPTVAEFTAEQYPTVAASHLRQMIRRTLFATDTESTRYALSGVLLEVKGESIILAATDTRRLAIVRGQCAGAGNEPSSGASPVVPSKAMALVERSLAEIGEPVGLFSRGNEVIFRAGPVTIHSRLVEGRFPKYQDVIPRDAKITVEMTAAPFYAAVRQAQIVTDEDSRGVDFRFGPGLLTMTSRARNIGESTVELPIGFHGPEIGITFDPQFVADFLRVLEPEQTLRIELVDSESAAVFRTDDGYTYIVMPLSRDR